MRNIIYGLVEEKYILGCEERTSYGIAAYADYESDGTITIVASANDISGDKQAVELFVDKCNKFKLSLLHFDDAVYDFLSR